MTKFISRGLLKTFTSVSCTFLRNRVTREKLGGLLTARNFTRSSAAMMSGKNEVLTQDMDGIFVISINRPENRNAVNRATAAKLVKAFKEFEGSDEYKVAVLTGTNGTFCAGYDLKELASSSPEEIATLKSSPFNADNALMGPSRMCFSKPVIAAISGYAVAGGLELALLCDLRVVEDDSVMGVFCRRFGVPLIDGGTVRLPRLIGLSRALDLILTGRAVQASEAYNMGLANSVVPKGEALNEAIQIARDIAKFPQECMRRDRMSAYHSLYDASSFQDAMKYEFFKGLDVIEEESVKGASRFAKGAGRHGKF